jgi:hypothetical protein
MQEKIFRISFLALAALLMAGLLTGCSHSPAVFTFGKKIHIGTVEYGEISYLDGIAIVDVSRENSSWTIEINDETGITLDKASNSIKGIKKISRTIGRQVTGYLTDLAEVDPAAAEEWLSGEHVDAQAPSCAEKEKEAQK